MRWAFVLLTLLSLVGCGEPSPREAIRLAVAGAPSLLDPRLATDATSARVNRLIYQRLIGFDQRQMPVPALADWQALTPSHYRFVLRRPLARFSDGNELTADDVVATLRDVLDPKRLSPHRQTLALIERVEAVDRISVDFWLSRADPLFPAYLDIGILPARLIAQGHDFGRRPVGSGPFELAGWLGEQGVRLRRRSDGQRVEILRVKDPTVRALKLVRGEVDLLQNDLPAEILRWLAEQPGVRVDRAPGSNFSYLGFNLRDPLLADRRVRQAIAHAIDRPAIIRALFNDAARPAQALLPPSHWAGNPALAPIAYDPGRARMLLAEAGYGPSRPLRLTYKTSADPFRLRIATVIQSQLAEVGIELAIRSFDWGTFFGDIKAGRFQLYSLTWVGIDTPDILRRVFHSQSVPPAGANRGRYASAAADRLLQQAADAGTLVEQALAYRKLQALLLHDLPYVPLWYEDHVVARRDGIDGYRLYPDGRYDGLITVRQNP